MITAEKYLALYIGCDSNWGRLSGLRAGTVFTISKDGVEQAHDLMAAGPGIQLHLRRLNSLTDHQSRVLIAKGFSIGRPKGYSFSPAAFLYLLELQVDLFGLIDAGKALDMSGMDTQ